MDRNGNVIYAVDFDGTLPFGKYPGVGIPNEKLFKFLISEKKSGARIILYTCRTKANLKAAVEFCRDHGLEFDRVNENLPDTIEVYGGDTRKISADFYIDDKSINPFMVNFSVWKPESKREREESNHVVICKEHTQGVKGSLQSGGNDTDSGIAASRGYIDRIRDRYHRREEKKR